MVEADTLGQVFQRVATVSYRATNRPSRGGRIRRRAEFPRDERSLAAPLGSSCAAREESSSRRSFLRQA